MSKQKFEGSSVEDALAKAAGELGVDVTDLEHELVEEKADDFWGLGEKVYVVAVWKEGEEPEPEPEPEPEVEEAPAPVEPKPAPSAQQDDDDDDDEDDDEDDDDYYYEDDDDDEEDDDDSSGSTPFGAGDVREIEPGVVVASPDDVPTNEPTLLATQEDLAEDDLPEAAVALLAKIFDAMDFECEAQARMEDDTLLVAINGDDNQFLLDGRGRGLSALELVLNHAFRHRTDGGRKKVRVDAGDFRSRRDDEIRDMAYQVAHQAKESGEAQQTRPLNPYERRIVHLTLAEDSQLTTRSEGSGFMKAVNIIPQGGNRR